MSFYRVYFMGDLIVKLFIKNVLFKKNWKRLLVKNKINTFNNESTTNRINHIEDLKKIKVLVIPVVIESLWYLAPSRA